MHAVNIDAGFHLSRELALKLIAARAPGSFLLLTSLHSGTPRNLPHYSTAKAALSMLVKELAKTLGRHGIRVKNELPVFDLQHRVPQFVAHGKPRRHDGRPV